MNISSYSRTMILGQFREKKIDINQAKIDAKKEIFKYINVVFEENEEIALKIKYNTLMTALKVSQELLNNPSQEYNTLYIKFAKYYGEINQKIFKDFMQINEMALKTVAVHRNGFGDRKYNFSNIFGGCRTNYTNSIYDIRVYIKKIYNHMNIRLKVAEKIIKLESKNKLKLESVYKLFLFAGNNKIFKPSVVPCIKNAKRIVENMIKKAPLDFDSFYNIIENVFLRSDLDLNNIAKSIKVSYLQEIISRDTGDEYKKIGSLFQRNYNKSYNSNIGLEGINFLKDTFKNLLNTYNEEKNSSLYNIGLIAYNYSTKNIDTPNSPIISRVKMDISIIIEPDEKLKYISDRLTNKAKLFFANLLKVENVERGNNHSTIILGDGDGSVGRLILAAIQSGHMILKDNTALNNLIAVLNLEANINYKDFQIDPYTTINLFEILKEAEFKSGDCQLVCIGDIIHDRFSNNKVVMADLIKSLHDKGVIFIRGNHDSIEHCFKINAQRKLISKLGKAQAGEDAVVQLEYEYAIELEKRFVNCYYDSNKNKFYIHNGISYNCDTEEYITAFGNIRVDDNEDINMLIKKINELKPTDDFTEFRPEDYEMQDLPIFVNNNCIIVHGHNSYQNIDEKVYNVNSRKEGTEFLVAAIKF